MRLKINSSNLCSCVHPEQARLCTTHFCFHLRPGHYVYIEASAPRQFGDVARIISQEYPATLGTCMRFWYYMIGSDLGQFNVYIEVNGNQGASVWSRSTSGYDLWRIAEVNVQTSYPFRVSFKFVYSMD